MSLNRAHGAPLERMVIRDLGYKHVAPPEQCIPCSKSGFAHRT